jgi:hypothetical protein
MRDAILDEIMKVVNDQVKAANYDTTKIQVFTRKSPLLSGA